MTREDILALDGSYNLMSEWSSIFYDMQMVISLIFFWNFHAESCILYGAI